MRRTHLLRNDGADYLDLDQGFSLCVKELRQWVQLPKECPSITLVLADKEPEDSTDAYAIRSYFGDYIHVECGEPGDPPHWESVWVDSLFRQYLGDLCAEWGVDHVWAWVELD